MSRTLTAPAAARARVAALVQPIAAPMLGYEKMLANVVAIAPRDLDQGS